MMSFGIGAWLAAHLQTTSVRQQEISSALKRAHEQNCAATKRNIEASERQIATPFAPLQDVPNPEKAINSLLCQIRKNRKARRDQTF